MTITPQRISKYLVNQDMSAPWQSQPIRIGATNHYFFVFYATGVGIAGTLSIQYAIDWLDINGTNIVPLNGLWTDSPFSFPIVAGLFTGLTVPAANANTDALVPYGINFVTAAEALRLRWVPTDGSAGTMSASFYAKSFG